MFGKRSGDNDTRAPKPAIPAPAPAATVAAREMPAPVVTSPPMAPAKPPPPAPAIEARRSDNYYQVKATIAAPDQAIDLARLAKLDSESAREEIRDIINQIIAIKISISIAEQEELLDDICNDVLGYGPLEPLLSRDDIADIMVNGAGTVPIEVAGRSAHRHWFHDNQAAPHLPAHRQPGRPARRPILADLRRAPCTGGWSTPSCAWRSAGPRFPSANSRRQADLVSQEFGAISPEGAKSCRLSAASAATC